jgi:hypothetical protein
MPQLIIVLMVLGGLYYGAKLFANASPAVVARLVRRAGGLAALAAAGLLLIRGQIEVAIPLGGFGLYLLGAVANHKWAGLFRTAGKSGGASRVRSAMIEMQLDHESGDMQGRVLSGTYAGVGLQDLARPQCLDLFDACRRDDPEGARLLEAYLDRRFPGWGPTPDDDRDARRGRRDGTMTEDEAYEVLGLAKGSPGEEVSRAHRALMKKLHPDHGGTTSLAARVNEAKDVLTRRHH